MNKIVFISIFKEGDGGGEGRVAYEMARCFSSHYDVAMLCTGEDTGFHMDETGFKTFTVASSGDKKFYLPFLSRSNIERIYAFLDEFSPDIIHAHDPALLGVIGQLWARIHNVPVVHTAHVLPMSILEFGTSEIIKIPSDSLTESLVERFLLNFYVNCDAVIALNQVAAQNIREFGYKGRILNIPNGRNLSQFNRCRISNIGDPIKVLSFIGFISHRKNQIFLVEMLRYLPENYHLWLIGEALKSEYQQEIMKVISQHHLENRISFIGQVSGARIPEYLEKTHVFVSASKMEVQSLVIIEALSSGTPVIGISNETVDELIGPMVGRRVDRSAEPAEFAAHVEAICGLPQEKYETLCLAARERVKDLDWPNIMSVTAAGYEDLIRVKVIESQPNIDPGVLQRIISPLPAGQVKETLGNLISRVIVLHDQRLARYIAKRSRISPGLRLVAGITIIGSIASYYFFNGPLKAWRKFHR